MWSSTTKPHSIIDTLELARKFRIPGDINSARCAKDTGSYWIGLIARMLMRRQSVLLWKMLDEYSDLIGDKVEDLLQSNKGSGGWFRRWRQG